MLGINCFITWMQQRNLSNNTIINYTSDIQKFILFMKNKQIDQILEEDVEVYLDNLRLEGCSPRTLNRKLSVIKTFYRVVLKKGLVKHNPTLLIERSKCKKELRKTISEKEYTNIFNLVDNLRDKVILEILFSTGARRSELINIKLSDIDFSDCYIKLLGKGNRERIVPVHSTIIDLIKTYCRLFSISGWLLPSPYNNVKHISDRHIANIIKYWTEKSGIYGISPHQFRHSFGTIMYENGADIKTIQDIMGHESINTTNLYAKTSPTRNKAEYEKCRPKRSY